MRKIFFATGLLLTFFSSSAMAGVNAKCMEYGKGGLIYELAVEINEDQARAEVLSAADPNSDYALMAGTAAALQRVQLLSPGFLDFEGVVNEGQTLGFSLRKVDLEKNLFGAKLTISRRQDSFGARIHSLRCQR